MIYVSYKAVSNSDISTASQNPDDCNDSSRTSCYDTFKRSTESEIT